MEPANYHPVIQGIISAIVTIRGQESRARLPALIREAHSIIRCRGFCTSRYLSETKSSACHSERSEESPLPG